jgi:serine/threonine protein kinase
LGGCSDQPTGRLALVFELMDMNIYELIRGRRHYIGEERLKHYMYQLMKAMDHMHRNGIFHRDIKPENILIMDDCLKVRRAAVALTVATATPLSAASSGAQSRPRV